MSRAVCPGSFDPVTHGHLDVVRRAARLFDEVVVAVGVNPSKSRLFGDEERLAMAERACAGIDGARVEAFDGLLTTFCEERGIAAVVKGLRGGADYDYELPMAQMNLALSGVETVFVPSDPTWSFVSSSLVKEVATLGGDVARFVPDFVLGPLLDRLGRPRTSGTG